MKAIEFAEKNYDCLECLRKAGLIDPWEGVDYRPTDEELAEIDRATEGIEDPNGDECPHCLYEFGTSLTSEEFAAMVAKDLNKNAMSIQDIVNLTSNL